MIIIGNKPYYKINIDNIIDTFEYNVRCNMGLPNFNNGTRSSIQYMNCHVYDNFHKNKMMKYVTMTKSSKSYVETFVEKFNKTDYIKIYKQADLRRHYNAYLQKCQCPHSFRKSARIGCNALFDFMLKQNGCQKLIEDNDIDVTNITITHFGITKDVQKDNVSHLYNVNKNYSDCHNINDEVDIIIWLHKKGEIDATLCCLLDTSLPVLDCTNITPTIKMSHRILSEFGVLILDSFYKPSIICDFLKEYDSLYSRNTIKKKQNNDSMFSSQTTKIECPETHISKLKTGFMLNDFLNKFAESYFQNKVERNISIETSTISESKQTKEHSWCGKTNRNLRIFLFLSDITQDNGNIQVLPCNYKHTKDDCKDTLRDITGSIGTVLIIDTNHCYRMNRMISGTNKYVILKYTSVK